MKIVTIPLIGSILHRNFADSDVAPIASTLDQRFINVVHKLVPNPVMGSQHARIAKRPGIDSGTTQTSAQEFYAVTYSEASASSLGTISVWADSAGIRVIEGNNGTATTASVTGRNASSRLRRFYNATPVEKAMFWVVSGAAANRKAFRYNADADTLTEITDADFPKATICGNFAWLDGYVFIMTGNDGKIWNCDLNDVTAWTATSFVSTQQQANGRGLAQVGKYIVAFGEDYIDTFENVGNSPGSPLQIVSQLRIRDYGIAGGDTPLTVSGNSGAYLMLEYANSVIWINNAATGPGIGVYMLEGFRPKKLSSSEVDFSLARIGEGNLFIGGAAKIYGYSYLFIGRRANATALVYCFETGIWFTWESELFNNADGSNWQIINTRSAVSGTSETVFLFSGTKTYRLSSQDLLGANFQDAAVAYTTTIQTRPLDMGSNRKKFWHRFTLIGSDSREASATNVSWSDDDGQTWSTARALDMNDGRPTTTRLGASRRRQWRITNAADAPFEAEAIELTFTEGTH